MIWDVDIRDHNGNQLTTMLNGLLADGFDMNTLRTSSTTNKNLLAQGIAPRTHHAHLCVHVPYTLFSNEADVDERVTVCKEYLREFRKHGMNPIILITQADIVEAQRALTSPGRMRTEQLRKILPKHLGVQMGDIHLLISYTVECERSSTSTATPTASSTPSSNAPPSSPRIWRPTTTASSREAVSTTVRTKMSSSRAWRASQYAVRPRVEAPLRAGPPAATRRRAHASRSPMGRSARSIASSRPLPVGCRQDRRARTMNCEQSLRRCRSRCAS